MTFIRIKLGVMITLMILMLVAGAMSLTGDTRISYTLTVTFVGCWVVPSMWSIRMSAPSETDKVQIVEVWTAIYRGCLMLGCAIAAHTSFDASIFGKVTLETFITLTVAVWVMMGVHFLLRHCLLWSFDELSDEESNTWRVRSAREPFLYYYPGAGLVCFFFVVFLILTQLLPEI